MVMQSPVGIAAAPALLGLLLAPAPIQAQGNNIGYCNDGRYSTSTCRYYGSNCKACTCYHDWGGLDRGSSGCDCCYVPPSPPPPSYCTTESGMCTAGSCLCRNGGHHKFQHSTGGTTCYSCGSPLPPPPSYCTTNSGKCTADSCSCESSTHRKLTLELNDGTTCYACGPPAGAGEQCNEANEHVCKSGVCHGGKCCGSSGLDPGCTRCGAAGSCTGCADGYFLSKSQCIKQKNDGEVCTLGNRECTSGACRAGRCCGAKGRSASCTSCGADGECNKCDCPHIDVAGSTAYTSRMQRYTRAPELFSSNGYPVYRSQGTGEPGFVFSRAISLPVDEECVGGFKLMESGTCPSTFDFIDSKARCKAAAEALALAGTTAGGNPHASNPYGCYFKKSDGALFWSTAGSKDDDDTDRVSICSCARSANVWLVGKNYSSTAGVIHSEPGKPVDLPDLVQSSNWLEYSNSAAKFARNAALSITCADSGPGFRFILFDGECTATTTSTTTTTTTLLTNGGRCDQSGECISGRCTAGRCIGSATAGSSCSAGYDCSNGVCRGGVCCGSSGKVEGCLQCRGGDGVCDICAEGYDRVDGNATAGQAGKTCARIPATPAAPATPPHCNANCTADMYNNTACDLECNTYECRYDHGACSRAMVKDMQRARLQAKQGKVDEAQALFEIICDAGLSAGAPSRDTLLDITGSEHKARVKEYDYQHMFAVTSCISAKNLALADTFVGQDGSQANGEQSYDTVKETLMGKLEALEEIDAQIARVSKLSKLFAHRENVGDGVASVGSLGELDEDMYRLISDQLATNTENLEGFVANTLGGKSDWMLAADLRGYIGANSSGINGTLDAQTQDLRVKATANMDRLEETLAMQRRIIADTLNSGDGMSELEKEIDELAEDVSIFVDSMEQFSERFGYWGEYANSAPSTVEINDLDIKSNRLTLSQRLVLVGLRRDEEAWQGTNGAVQSDVIALLNDEKVASALSGEARAAVNTAMQAQLKETLGFSQLGEADVALSPSQRKTLKELSNNIEMMEVLDKAEITTLAGLLDGSVTPKALDATLRADLNEALALQRTMTGFSHSWDDDGDGLMSAPEMVKLLMDSVAPPTLPVGKVLTPFRDAELVDAGLVQFLVRRHFGNDAANMIGSAAKATSQGIANIDVEDVIHVLSSSRRRYARRQRQRRAENGEDCEDVEDAGPRTQTCDQKKVQEAWDGVKKLEEMYNRVKLGAKLYQDLSKSSVKQSEGGGGKSNSGGKPTGGGGDYALTKIGKAAWTNLAPAAFDAIAEALVDKKENPILAGGLKVGAKALGAMVQGKSPLTAALMATAGVGADLACELKKMCTGKDCMSVVGDITTGVQWGGAAGGLVAGVGAAPGAVLGAGIGLVKSGFTGELGRCAKGLWNNLKPQKVAENIKAAYRAGRKFVATAEKYFTDRVVEPVKRLVATCRQGIEACGSALAAGAQSAVGTGRRIIESAVQGGRALVNSGVRTLVNAGRSVTNAMYRGAQYLGRSFNHGVDYVGRKMYETYDSARTAVSYAGRAIGRMANSAYNGVRSVVSRGFDVAQSVGRSVSSTARSMYNGVRRGVSSAYSSAKSAISSASSWLGQKTGWWRRRRRNRRGVDLGNSTGTEAVDSILPGGALDDTDEIAEDLALLAGAALNLFNVADGLYFNVTKGVPVDLGILTYPDVAAKYTDKHVALNDGRAARATAQKDALLQSLNAVQSHAMRKVDLDAQIQTAGFLTDNVGRCLLDSICDLQDDVDRYALALELMQSKRSDTVVDILEKMATLSKALEVEVGATPSLDAPNISDVPIVADLTAQVTNLDAVRAMAEATKGRNLIAKSGVVYYTFDSTTHPEAFDSLAGTGVAYVTVPAPKRNTKYRDARVKSMSAKPAQAFVYPAIATSIDGDVQQEQPDVSVYMTKGGFSLFVPVSHGAEPTMILHPNTALHTTFMSTFSTANCSAVTAEASLPTAPENSEGLALISPYGEWRIEVGQNSRELFTMSTHLRLVFHVDWFEYRANATGGDGSGQLYKAMFGNDGCDRAMTCFVEEGERPVSDLECTLHQSSSSTKDRDPIITSTLSTGTVTKADASKVEPSRTAAKKVPVGTGRSPPGTESTADPSAVSPGADSSGGLSLGTLVAVIAICCLICVTLTVVGAWRYQARKSPGLVLQPLSSPADHTDSTAPTVNNPAWAASTPKPTGTTLYSVPFVAEPGTPAEPLRERQATVVVTADPDSSGSARSRIVSISNGLSKPVQSNQTGDDMSQAPMRAASASLGQMTPASPRAYITPTTEPHDSGLSSKSYIDVTRNNSDSVFRVPTEDDPSKPKGYLEISGERVESMFREPDVAKYDVAAERTAIYSGDLMPSYDIASNTGPALYAAGSTIPSDGAVVIPSYDLAVCDSGAAVYSEASQSIATAGVPKYALAVSSDAATYSAPSMPSYDQARLHPSTYSCATNHRNEEPPASSQSGISRGRRPGSVQLHHEGLGSAV